MKQIKSWLITTSAPFCGTDQYYTAFSEEDPLEIESINEWFWNEETENLWDAYSEQRHQKWKKECTIDAEEMSLEELVEYGFEGELPEIIYDERGNDKVK